MLIMSGILSLPLPVLAKDYFGFNFEHDNRTTCLEKLDRYWIDYQHKPTQIVFIRSGVLKLIASYLQQGSLWFDQQDKLLHIDIVAENTSEIITKLADHLNEDYDFDQTTESLNVSQFKDGNQWQILDKRGVLWCFHIHSKQIYIRVTAQQT